VVGGTTTDKLATGLTVNNLAPGTTNYFVVRTVTPPHGSQQNEVTSEDSVEVSATTSGAFTCASVTELPQSECEALVALYNSTNGPNWTQMTIGW
jgi:hypothetical protein